MSVEKRSKSSYIIGVDTGGTFTDAVAIDEKGRIFRAKVLSTPPEFEKGIMNALDRLDEIMGTPIGEVTAFCFGTTVATNALWTRGGAKIGMLTTRGFEDVPHIARGISKWAGLPEAEIKHQSVIRKPKSLIPKDLIMGIDERVDWDGDVIVPLNTDQVKVGVETLAKKGVEGVAVCYLWSISNPAHEEETKKITSELYPELYCTCSANIARMLGEYERFNNAIVDAYVGPVTVRFLQKLEKMLRAKGLKCELMTMKADGGSVLTTEALPLATIHSGPTGGVLCAKFMSHMLGHENVITADVGGTSFDISLIREGELAYTREPVLEKFSCSYPSLDIKSIGAGGGSIVWAEPRLKTVGVGPKSAGAMPGPACYGFGGTEPTVTDAILILGYLNPDYFLGGTMKLYPDKARRAMRKVADRIGMSLVDAAAGVYDLINAHCTDLIRLSTVERGFNPHDFFIYAFGGSGPAHTIEWAMDLGAKGVVIAPYASIYSAMGMALSDVLVTEVYYDYGKMPMDVDRFNKAFAILEKKLTDVLSREGIGIEDAEVSYFVDCKYPTVFYSTRVPIPRKQYRAADMEEFIPKAFDAEYERLYGKGSAMTRVGREIVGFTIQGHYSRIKPILPKLERKGVSVSQALKSKREAYFKKYKSFVSTNVYDFEKLQPGNIIEGPAIIEAIDTTVVIPPDQKGEVDEYLNIMVKLG